jgi:hypothetical protein
MADVKALAEGLVALTVKEVQQPQQLLLQQVVARVPQL